VIGIGLLVLERLRKSLSRDGSVRVEEQERERGALKRASEVERLALA
jgi:hypothetical protein